MRKPDFEVVGSDKTKMSYVMRTPVFAICECSLISPFVVRYLDSVIPLVSISKISSLYLASVAEQTSFSFWTAGL